MRRIIREVDPPRPSTRVSTLEAADLSTISERRQVEPRKLSQQLRGDLDWIVMKALEKDRNRRYATASDLAEDIERYLRDEPVLAGPPSTAYRLRKFARRNKRGLLTAAAGVLVLLLGVGAIGGSVGLFRTRPRGASRRGSAHGRERAGRGDLTWSSKVSGRLRWEQPSERRRSRIAKQGTKNCGPASSNGSRT